MTKLHPFGEAFDFMRKSGQKASEGNLVGSYPFFSSSPIQSKWTDLPQFECDALIFGTGGEASIHHVNGSFGTSSDCLVAVAKTEKDIARFHYHYLRFNIQLISSGFRGAGLRHVSKSHLEAMLVPDMDGAEQRRIASVLDKANLIHQKRAAIVSFAGEYLRSAYFDAFGDPVINSRNFPESPIREIATVTTGNTPSREMAAYYGDHIEWIKSDNINTPSHFLTKATEGLSEAGLRVGRSVPAGSTLITCIAGSPSCIGNAALADRSVSFNQQINALTPKPGIEPEFIYATTLFSKARIQAASTNGMKGMVSKGALEQVRFILPPPDQREKFVAIFRKVMALTAKLESASSEASMLYGSLAQRAFQGQLSGL